MKRLTSKAMIEPTPNQKIKNPVVSISQTKNIPVATSQNTHISIPPKNKTPLILYYIFPKS